MLKQIDLIFVLCDTQAYAQTHQQKPLDTSSAQNKLLRLATDRRHNTSGKFDSRAEMPQNFHLFL